MPGEALTGDRSPLFYDDFFGVFVDYIAKKLEGSRVYVRRDTVLEQT